MILDVRKIGDPILKQRCEPVSVSEMEDDALISIVLDMVATMRDNEGIGLAANQIGVSKRILVIDAGTTLALINPVIWEYKNWVVGEEGCLSIPDKNYDVKRATWIKVKFTNVLGQEHEVVIDDPIIARVVQHEVDHLNGVLISDYE
jgi:peptide deformylase